MSRATTALLDADVALEPLPIRLLRAAFRFDHGDMRPPFSPVAYTEAIAAAREHDGATQRGSDAQRATEERERCRGGEAVEVDAELRPDVQLRAVLGAHLVELRGRHEAVHGVHPEAPVGVLGIAGLYHRTQMVPESIVSVGRR